MTLLGTVLTHLYFRSETHQRICCVFMNIKDAVQLREFQQVHDLPPRIAQLQLAPRLPLTALTLWARIPMTFVIFENGRTAFGTNGLRDCPKGHDQLTKTAA